MMMGERGSVVSKCGVRGARHIGQDDTSRRAGGRSKSSGAED